MKKTLISLAMAMTTTLLMGQMTPQEAAKIEAAKKAAAAKGAKA